MLQFFDTVGWASGRASGLSDDQCGYLSEVRCGLFAYGPADDTASRNAIISCLIQIQTGFTFLVLVYPGCPGKEAVKWV